MNCECEDWARENIIFVTEHHTKCAKYNPQEDAARIIKALIQGIEDWAADEDGVHPDCWDAYVRARASIGNPVKELLND